MVDLVHVYRVAEVSARDVSVAVVAVCHSLAQLTQRFLVKVIVQALDVNVAFLPVNAIVDVADVGQYWCLPPADDQVVHF